MNVEEPTVKRLLEENEDFRRLRARHLRYKQQIADLDKQPHLTADQEVERRTLQKLKLAGKDEMAAMVREAGGS